MSKFSRKLSHPDVKILGVGKNICRRIVDGYHDFRTCCIDYQLEEGNKYSWVVKYETKKNVVSSFVGVLDVSKTHPKSFTTAIGNKKIPRSWGLYLGKGDKRHKNESIPYIKKRKIKSGDSIGIHVDLKNKRKGEICFSLNGVRFLTAFKNVTAPLVPAVSLRYCEESYSIIEGVKKYVE